MLKLMTSAPAAPYQVVRETWLTRKPKRESFAVALLSTAAFLVGSLIYLNNWFGAGEWMAASPADVFGRKQIWRLWTTLFAHADMGHFLSNSFLFFILGFFLYGYFGRRIFPLGALIAGGLVNLIVLPTYSADTRLIGVSGVIYLMGGMWLTFYFLLSRQKNRTQRFLRSAGVALLMFMPAEAFDPTISYRTHFAGFVVGVLLAILHYQSRRTLFLAAEKREWVIEE
jgi:rhomboid protease GluP